MRIMVGLALAIACVLPVLAADTTRTFNDGSNEAPSLQSGLMSDSLRLLLSVPGLQGDGMLKTARDVIDLEFDWTPPDEYELTTVPFKTFKAERLHKKGSKEPRAVLMLHGGAYVLGLMNTYRDIAVSYSGMTAGGDVLMPDYRLAPENVFPAALDDALEAWDWLLAQGYKPENILVAGDSAGGNLSLALVLKLRDQKRPLPGAMVLMSPWTDMTASGRSHTENMDKDPIFGGIPEYLPPPDGKMPDPRPFILSYVGDTDPRNPYLSPAFGQYQGFPPMLIQVGTAEVLESDAEIVYQKAAAAGVDATLTRYAGQFHDFQVFMADILPEAVAAWDEVQMFIAQKFLIPSIRRGDSEASGK